MNRKQLQRMAAKAAQKYGVPPNLFFGLIEAESNWNPSARSPMGAVGITQVVPKYHPNADLSTPASQLDYGAKHLGQLLRKYGNPQDALSVYNSGRPWSRGRNISETANYVPKVMQLSKKYQNLPYYPATGTNQPGGGGNGDIPPHIPLAPVIGQVQQSAGNFINAKALQNIMNREGKRALSGQMPSKQFMPQIAKLARMATNKANRISAQAQAGYHNYSQELEDIAAQQGGPEEFYGPPLPGQGGNVNQQAQQLAKRFGLKITSGRRSPEENRRVGGSPTSAHLTGRGFDFAGPPDRMMALARWAGNQGSFGEVFYDPWGQWDNDRYQRQGIGGHSDHVHITF